jgi:competence protein ComEC
MSSRAWPTHDGFVVLLAASIAAGAWWAGPVPLAVAVLAVAVALLVRRATLLLLAAVLLAAALGARADEGMVAPEPGPVEGTAMLVGDPVRESGSVRVGLRLHGRHFEAWARGEPAVQIERRLAGEIVAVRGSVSSRPVPTWLRARHVVARLELTAVEWHGAVHPLYALANGARRLLDAGARPLDREARALFTGLVIGDDREQSLETTDDFRGSGLAHLLAVSGQNVAFVLTIVEPIARRLTFRARLALVLAVLVVFATITRFEPSVLRATVMAGLATTAATLGRPTASIRVLGLAVGGLVLVDPFLVRSVGFGLSVAASAGIVLWSRPIARALPGPDVVGRALGVVLAAQAAVTPLLVIVFGGAPVVGPIANVLAEPVAGLVMVWGSSAGVLAGLAPDLVAAPVHVPTAWALAWVAGVARWAAGAGLGELGAATGSVAFALGFVAVNQRVRRPRTACAAVAMALLVVASPAVRLRLADGPRRLDGVGTLWVERSGDHPVLELDGSARPATALRELRAQGIDRLDAIVLQADSAAGRRVVALLERRIRVGRVLVEPTGPTG